MRPIVLPALLAAALLAGCSNDPPDTEATAGEPASSPSPSAAPTPSPSTAVSPFGENATGEDDGEPTAPAEQPFPADRSEDTAQAVGNGLSVVEVRTGRHEGYDRVVFELGGEGTVGWSVQYDDDPRTQGQGAAVELAGDATLALLITGVGYPFDTGVEEYDGPRTLTPGHPVVKEVELGGVFEGSYDAFVGVAQERPFRVFRLTDPQRVVVDVAHTG
jgi:hypothetical protein